MSKFPELIFINKIRNLDNYVNSSKTNKALMNAHYTINLIIIIFTLLNKRGTNFVEKKNQRLSIDRNHQVMVYCYKNNMAAGSIKKSQLTRIPEYLEKAQYSKNSKYFKTTATNTMFIVISKGLSKQDLFSVICLNDFFSQTSIRCAFDVRLSYMQYPHLKKNIFQSSDDAIKRK